MMSHPRISKSEHDKTKSAKTLNTAKANEQKPFQRKEGVMEDPERD
jgi:hypothetical protein